MRSFKEFNFIRASDIYDKAVDLIYAYRAGTIRGIPLGIPKLDTSLGGGLVAGDIVVIGARPGTGKSALATFFIKNVVDHEDLPVVLYFNFEMTGISQMWRIFSNEANVTVNQMKGMDGGISSEAFERIEYLKEWCESKDLYFMDVNATVDEMFDAVGAAVEHFVGRQIILVVDHTRLVLKAGRETEENMISNLMLTLNYMAKNFKTIAIVLSQLNREFEKDVKTKFRLPVLSDLFGSDAVGQIATLVMFPYSSYKFGFKTIPMTFGKQVVDVPSEHILSLSIEKSRSSPADKILHLAAWLGYNKFEEFDEKHYEDLTGRKIVF